jgi:hypothetical protein
MRAETAEMTEVWDCHAHVFPAAVAARAVAAIGAFYNLPMDGRGTVDDLLEVSRTAGIAHSVIFSTATRRDQVASINRFMAACQQAHTGLIAFGTLHPTLTVRETADAIEQAIASGLRGIKLHPDFQQTAADSPFVIAAARLLSGRLPLIIHAGDPRHDYSQPLRIRHLADAAPKTQIVAAHLGGWGQWRRAAGLLAGRPNVWVDTSSSLSYLEPDEAVALIRVYGADRVLFGTDYPMWRPQSELVRFNRLPLTALEKQQILHDNACRLLGGTNQAVAKQ